MAVTERERRQAEKRMAAIDAPRVQAARYVRGQGLVVLVLSNGVQIGFPPHLVEGLAGATPAALRTIDVSPSGLGLHWPRLDADVYLPALLRGVFGSAGWMAAALGAEGGRARTQAKADSARRNGCKGGRPRKVA